MEKIILFDIDGTLFDPMLFLKNYFLALKPFNLDVALLKTLYEETRNEFGYFIPERFLEKLAKKFPQVPKDELTKSFWNIELFEKSMYEDISVIKDLAGKAVIGVFSKGEKKFQDEKILFIREFLDEKNVYIFPNKIDKISEVLGKYSMYKIYMVDDREDVLTKTKGIDPDVVAILIDRSNNYGETSGIIKIDNLNRINELI